ncbi:hypothetical protein [Priestia megaterium]|uniref:hypothetical protein n=1 Tax=Priestia megaterium TaxID=1404 RepID=UPI002E1AB38E|nr:hypothetical protein [Priestia megaterium]
MKQIQQSQKIVSKAVGVFSTAVADVEKANDILKKGIEADSMKISAIADQMDKLEEQIRQLEDDKLAKGNEIKKNENLLATLRQFTKEA